MSKIDLYAPNGCTLTKKELTVIAGESEAKRKAVVAHANALADAKEATRPNKARAWRNFAKAMDKPKAQREAYIAAKLAPAGEESKAAWAEYRAAFTVKAPAKAKAKPSAKAVDPTTALTDALKAGTISADEYVAAFTALRK